MSGLKRVLIIAPQPFFSARGTPFSVYYRTLVLAQSVPTARIDLLTYGQGEDVHFPSGNVKIIRIPRFGIRHVKVGPSLVKALLDVWLVVYTIVMLVRRRYDVVHAHEESVFWCRFLQPVFRFKLIYDMHSSLPQQLTNFNFTHSQMLISAFDRLETTCLHHADAVITICPELQDYALARGVPPARHFLIENSIFDDVPVNGHTAAPSTHHVAHGNNGTQKPRIVYAGTFEAYQGIELLITAFAHVAAEHPTAILVLVGGYVDQVQKMQRLATQIGVGERCIFTGQLSKSNAMEHIRTADVLVSPRTHGTNTPLKIYEQLASGVPLVATRIRSHTQVLTDEVCVLVEPDAASLAAGLLCALCDEERRSTVVQAAQAMYEGTYSRAAYESKLQRCLEAIS